MAPQSDTGTVAALLREPDRAWWVRAVGFRVSCCWRNTMSGAICPLHQHQAPWCCRVKGQTEVPQPLQHRAAAHCLVPVLAPAPPWHSQSPAHSPFTTGYSPHLWDVFQGVPSSLSLGLSFCTYPQCRGPRLAEPLVQTIGARPGPESQASLGTSGLRVPLSQSLEAGLLRCSGKLSGWCPD